MAATSLTRSYNAFLSATRDKYLKTAPANAIIKTNPTHAWLAAKGRKRMLDGGAKIAVPIMYGKNSTVASISPYQQFSISPQDGITTAFYDYAEYVVSVSISNLELKQHQGGNAVFDLMRAKTDQAIKSLAEKLNIDLWAIAGLTTATTGNSGKNIISIPMYVPKTAVASCSIDVGGIDCSVETWWYPNTSAIVTDGSTTFIGVYKNLFTCMTACSYLAGTGTPDLAITDPSFWNWYMAALNSKMQYTNNPKNADIGFPSIALNGAELFWDRHMADYTNTYDWDNGSFTTNGQVVFINSDYMEWGVLKGFDFEWTPFQQPEDQLARVSSCAFAGNLLCSNRAAHGVVFDIDHSSITS